MGGCLTRRVFVGKALAAIVGVPFAQAGLCSAYLDMAEIPPYIADGTRLAHREIVARMEQIFEVLSVGESLTESDAEFVDACALPVGRLSGGCFMASGWREGACGGAMSMSSTLTIRTERSGSGCLGLKTFGSMADIDNFEDTRLSGISCLALFGRSESMDGITLQCKLIQRDEKFASKEISTSFNTACACEPLYIWAASRVVAKSLDSECTLVFDSTDLAIRQRVGNALFELNEKGQTFGSIADADTSVQGLQGDFIETLPDLVLAMNQDGTRGYVRKEDLALAEEIPGGDALRPGMSSERGSREVMMYDVDGNPLGATCEVY